MSDLKRGQKSPIEDAVWCPNCGWVGPEAGECTESGKWKCEKPIFTIEMRKAYDKKYKIFEKEANKLRKDYEKKLKALKRKLLK